MPGRTDTSEALDWRKSSFSSDQGGNCVEIAVTADRVHVRDSKNPNLATLSVAPGTWSAFLHGLRAGDLDEG